MEKTEAEVIQQESGMEVEAKIPCGRFIAGSYAMPDRHTRAGMRTLGDNLNLLARLERELIECWQPRDAMQRLLVADLARIYTKKAELDSAVIGARVAEYRRVSAAIEKYESNPVSSDPPIDGGGADYYGMRSITDCQDAFEECKEILNILLDKVSRQEWNTAVGALLKQLYGKAMLPPGQEIQDQFTVLAAPNTELTEAMRRFLSDKLRKILEDEMADTLNKLAAFKNQRRQEFIAALGASWAPASQNWSIALAQEAMLDRMISWKIKLLLRLQRREPEPSISAPRENSFPIEVDEGEWRFNEGELRACRLPGAAAGAVPAAGEPEDRRAILEKK